MPAEGAKQLAALSDLRQKGKLAEAIALLRQMLMEQPGNSHLLHQLAEIEIQAENFAASLSLIEQAIQLMPGNPEFLTTRSIVLRRLGRLGEALDGCADALAVAPSFARALNCRGNILSELSRFDEALTSYDSALTAAPDTAEFLKNRGIALFHLGRFEEALDSHDQALSRKPDFVEALKCRGDVLKRLGRLDDALASYDRALALAPRDIRTLNNRADLLRETKRLNEALRSYDRVLQLAPDNVRALHHRSYALRELHRFGEALESCELALKLQPRNASLLAARGIILECQGRIGEAIASFRQSLAIRPDPAVHTTLIFAMNFDPSASAHDKQQERARWNSQYARPLGALARSHENRRDPHRRLRIGYVSAHFKGQSATYAFGGVLLNHDPSSVEIFCYSDTAREDKVTARLRASVDHWRHVAGLSDDRLAELVREDGIDILVDAVGHMGGNRLLTFARKPAPVQVTGWGEPTGTGLETMDYLLADPVLVPESERKLLAEHVVHLPNFLGYWSPEAPPEPGPLPAFKNGYLTFGSFNRLEKVTDAVLQAWASILRSLPSARLIIKSVVLSDPDQKRRIIGCFGAEGVAAERLILLAASSRDDHFAAYQAVDIALDTFPHSGGMTTLDALSMGIPVVTWAGQSISSRLAASCLTALGLTDFIANDAAGYVELARAKSADIEAIGRLRAGLRDRLTTSEFGDGARYARAVESAYREMWKTWCSKTR